MTRPITDSPSWAMVDEGWGRKAVDFATLSEPGNCREYVAVHHRLASMPTDIQALRDSGLDDGQIFAITAFVALRLAFSTINDSLGAQPDAQLAQSLPREVREAVTYGRPVAQAAAV